MESDNSISGYSPDFRTELARVIESVSPDVISDGKIDFSKLEELLKDDIQGVSSALDFFGLARSKRLELLKNLRQQRYCQMKKKASSGNRLKIYLLKEIILKF